MKSCPDVLSSAPLSPGQTLKLLVEVNNPQTNNVVTLTVSPSFANASQAHVSSTPVWEFDWTPIVGDVGVEQVTFNKALKKLMARRTFIHPISKSR